MKKKYYGIVISESITDSKLLEEIKEKSVDIYSHKLNGTIDTTIFKIELFDDEIMPFSTKISQNILPIGYYVHFVCDNEMIVVFNNKIFKISKGDNKSIQECIKYGISVGIDAHMLKFNDMYENDHPNDKNAVIFGGSGDLGQEFIKTLYDNGYSVYSTYNKNKINSIKSRQYKFDVKQNNNAFFELLKKKDIKVLVFCIGIRSSKKYVVDTNEDEFSELLYVNAISFLNIYKELSQTIRKNKTKVLVVSSSASLENKKTNGAYSSSKAYLDSIAETLKKEESDYGVEINIIHPTLFDSKLAREIVKMKGYNDFDVYVDEELNGKIKKTSEIVDECKKYIL